MYNVSDTSDVNSDEIAQIVDDIDDLDDELLNSSFKRQKSQSGKTVKSSDLPATRNVKKRVMFQDFTDNDPLADFVSDDEDVQKKEKNTTSSGKNSLMEDLFGIKPSDSTTSDLKSQEKHLDPVLINKEAVQTNLKTFMQPKVSRRDSFSDLQNVQSTSILNESFLSSSSQRTRNPSNVDSNTKTDSSHEAKPIDDKLKKSQLMEDLFGNRQTASLTNIISKPTSNPKLGLEISASQPTVNKPKIESTAKAQPTDYAPSVTTQRESRRGRRRSGIIDDPLGLLSSSLPDETLSGDMSKKDSLSTVKTTESMQSTELSKKTSGTADLPEWLGGSKKIESDKSDNAIEVLSQPTDKSSKHDTHITQISSIAPSNMEQVQSFPEHASLLASAQFNQQAAIMTMQQQEHELRTAMTLSQQNNQLSQLIEAQQSKLNEQEQQFNLLIKKQMERQILLEAQMKAQQARINQYIQTLMAQPTSVPTAIINTSVENINEITDKEKIESEETTQKIHKKKLDSDKIVHSLNEKHGNEMILQEEFYKRQISFLQEAMENMENRMRREIEILEMDHKAKMEKLQEETQQIENSYKEKIDDIQKRYAQYIEELHERHSYNIKLLQKEHTETIENICKAKEVDNLATAAITSHKTDIESVLQKTETIIDSIKDIHEKVEQRDETIVKEKEKYLKMQEENIESQKHELNKQKEFLHVEHEKLMETAHKLESRVTLFVTELQKRDKLYTETEERLNAKEQSLLRERELFEEKTKWERNHFQVLKESWLKEHQRQVKEFIEEKENLTSEKAKLEVLNRLRVSDEDVKKIELESIIKTAQDAIIAANQEKLKWRERLNELEAQRQNLQQKENQLILRAKELENLTQSAIAKRDEGLKALKDAQQLESQYKERLGKLQMQLEAVAQRENKIATEKLTLARERIALRTSEAEKPERDVRLSIPHSYTENPSLLSNIQPLSTMHFNDVLEPHLVLLKLDLDSQLDTANKYL